MACKSGPSYTLTLITPDTKGINIKFNNVKMVDKVITDLQQLRRWIVEDDRIEALYKGDRDGTNA